MRTSGLKITERCAALIALGLATVAGHAQIVFFDFNANPSSPPVTEDLTVGTPTVVQTGGSVVVGGQSGTSYTDFSGTVHPAGQAAAFDSGVNDPPSNQVLFTVNTTGYADLKLRYDYRATSAGPSGATFAYRVGGSGDFTTWATDAFTRDSAFHEISYDLTSLAAIDSQSVVEFRWDTYSGGSGGGTFRMDNLELIALSIIPEPHQYALAVGLGLGALAVVRNRCRRKP